MPNLELDLRRSLSRGLNGHFGNVKDPIGVLLVEQTTVMSCVVPFQNEFTDKVPVPCNILLILVREKKC